MESWKNNAKAVKARSVQSAEKVENSKKLSNNAQFECKKLKLKLCFSIKYFGR